MKRWLALAALLVASSGVRAQFTGDVLGAHDLSPGGQSPIKGGGLPPCQYCHAPHSGIAKGPLWAQTYSSQTYTLYSSTTTANQTMMQPPIAAPSSLCLSCHDGTIAPGQTLPYGQIPMTGKMNTQDVFGAALQNSHPFSFNQIKDSPDLVQTLVANQQTADPLKKVSLINGNVECESCHNPHVQNGDVVSLNFLVRDSSRGAMCLACHGTTARSVNNLPNPLVPWPTSIHANAANVTLPGAGVGPYNTVAGNACSACHMEHNANGPARLLRGATPALANMDASTQNCISCHNGNNNVSPALLNVYAEMTKTSSHPAPSGTNAHDTNETVLLNNNRHATCVDCHNPHGAQQVGGAFPNAPQIRVSQNAVNGISASDGISTMAPAQNQYENCLRCHGTSSGKPTTTSTFGYLPLWAVSVAGDAANVIPQFATTATSSHPVTHVSSSPYPQPSLLPRMLQSDGITQGRPMGTQVFCTDCHNSDDAREFGGTGPNGPHGSIYPHIFERRYEMSQVAPGTFPAGGPGSPILASTLFPGPLTSAGGGAPGPWALCGKCHDLSNVFANNTFQYHALHVSTVGVSCSVCHTAHGLGATSPTISGERLVDFDTNVVAPNTINAAGAIGVSYSRSTNTCALVCHGYSHNYDGTVTQVSSASTTATKPGVPVKH
ncbi:MAG TPA: cytochrome c3 family protein [Candidatus Sulfotelmatobacter sp.]|nr:cytochrome c3 family protein [Candidatus Sulfotelmatobacter sp.]